MEMSPQTVRNTSFRVVKKGYDPDEVDAFKDQVATVVETAQNQATAMEARARAAVAKLQEVTSQMGATPAQAAAPAAAASSVSGDTEVISRTLLLAQRTADAAIAEARTEADRLLSDAREEAGRVLDSARSMASKAVDEARADARRSVADERIRAESEVQSLLARRDFLIADVEHLEQFIVSQRERLRDAAVQLHDMVERVPGGLADMRRPLLSASAEPLPTSMQPIPPDPTGEVPLVHPTFGDISAPIERPAQPTLPAAPSFSVAPTVVTPAAPSHVWRSLDDLEEPTGEVEVPPVDTTSETAAPHHGGDVTGEVPSLPSLRPLSIRRDDETQ
jgi:DivIVA domain-containing protein